MAVKNDKFRNPVTSADKKPKKSTINRVNQMLERPAPSLGGKAAKLTQKSFQDAFTNNFKSGALTPGQNPRIRVDKQVAGDPIPGVTSFANPQIRVDKTVGSDNIVGIGGPNVTDPRGGGRAALDMGNISFGGRGGGLGGGKGGGKGGGGKGNGGGGGGGGGGKNPDIENPPLPPVTPPPTAKPYMNADWSKVVSHYFPETTMKDGGLVRGGGAAMRGRGRGKMV